MSTVTETETTPAIMDAKEAADYLRITEGALKKRVREGVGPAFARISRKLAFRKADLDAWISAQFAAKPAKKVTRKRKTVDATTASPALLS